LTPLGIEPTTFRLVAQGFNHQRHRVPHMNISTYIFLVYPYYNFLNITLNKISNAELGTAAKLRPSESRTNGNSHQPERNVLETPLAIVV
jgi:hypothetical protein